MASGQMFGVTGNRRLKRNQLSELRARQAQFPSILAAEQAADQQRKEQEFKEKQLRQDKKIAQDELKFKRSEAKRRFGMEMGKLGINLAMSDMLSGKTLGTIGSDIKGIFGGGKTPAGAPKTSFQPPGTPGRAMSGTPKAGGGFFSNIPIGSIAAGGLTGFGVGQMFGEKGGLKKSLFGGLAGGALGLLSGGGLSGAVGGGLGGLFGGMIG